MSSDIEKMKVLKTLSYYRQKKFFLLFGFVVMSNHVHLLVQPNEGFVISDIIRRFKTWTSREKKTKPVGTPLWENRFDDNLVKSQKEFRDILNYIHNNPVRAGMTQSPEAYPWSSIHSFLDDGREIIPVDKNWT